MQLEIFSGRVLETNDTLFVQVDREYIQLFFLVLADDLITSLNECQANAQHLEKQGFFFWFKVIGYL